MKITIESNTVVVVESNSTITVTPVTQPVTQPVTPVTGDEAFIAKVRGEIGRIREEARKMTPGQRFFGLVKVSDEVRDNTSISETTRKMLTDEVVKAIRTDDSGWFNQPAPASKGAAPVTLDNEVAQFRKRISDAKNAMQASMTAINKFRLVHLIIHDVNHSKTLTDEARRVLDFEATDLLLANVTPEERKTMSQPVTQPVTQPVAAPVTPDPRDEQIADLKNYVDVLKKEKMDIANDGRRVPAKPARTRR